MRAVNEFIQNLRAIYQTVPEGVLITDQNGKIVFINNPLLSYCSTVEKQWLNKNADAFLIGFDPLTNLKALTKKKAIFSKINLKKAKKKEVALKSLIILLETNERQVGFIYIIRLIDDYPTVNAYSNENNAITRVLNSKDNEVWFISDFQKLQILFCSAGIKKVCGWTVDEFIFGAWSFCFLLTHPMDRANVLELLMSEMALRDQHQIIYDHIPIMAKFRMRTRDNSWVWIEDRVTVLERDENGMIKYMISSLSPTHNPELDEKSNTIKLLEKDLIVKDGKTYVNLDTILYIQRNNIENFKSSKAVTLNNFHLSNREMEILSFIVDGLSSEEISNKIHITKNTVNMHRKQIMKKMQAKNLADLVRKSLESGLFSKNV